MKVQFRAFFKKFRKI